MYGNEEQLYGRVKQYERYNCDHALYRSVLQEQSCTTLNPSMLVTTTRYIELGNNFFTSGCVIDGECNTFVW